MDGNIKLSATVISCMGNDSDRDDFYFNGNFSNCHNTQSIQCSFEKSSNNYIFAISDSLGLEDGDTESISAIREIKKYHESAKMHQFSLENISERIYETVQLSSNLVYSKSIIDRQNSSILTGFSSLIVDNNRAVVMNLGNNGAFLYRQGVQAEIFPRGGGRKDEKLKMLGITPKTPDIYNDTEKILKLAEEESKTKIKISPSFDLEEGDLLILCSDGLLNNIIKSRLEAVAYSGFDPSKMASVLFQEASKGGLEEGITIMVVRVDEIKNIFSQQGNRRMNQVDLHNEPEEDEEEERSGGSIVNYILGFVCVLVISGVLFMGYLIIKNSGFFAANPPDDTAQTSLNSQSAATITKSAGQVITDSDDTGGEPANNSQTDGSQPGKSGGTTGNSGSSTDDSGTKDGNSGGGNSDAGNAGDEYELYVVQAGDTFSSISNKFYGTPNKYSIIMKYNNIEKDNSLFAGQEIKVPKQ